MFDSMKKKFKSYFDIPYQAPDVIGYAPYTEKAIAAKVPIYLDDALDEKLFAACHYNVMQSTVSGISVNSKYVSCVSRIPSSVEHESVHADQVSNPRLKKACSFQPLDFVAHSRLLETEAYARQSYKVLHDFKEGILTDADLRKNNLLHYSTVYMFGLATGTPVEDNRISIATLEKFKLQNEMPPEEDMLFDTMFNLAGNQDVMRGITCDHFDALNKCNAYMQHYQSSIDTKGLKKTIKEIEELPENIFTQKLTLDDIPDTINRDGTNYLKNVNAEKLQAFQSSLFTMDSQQAASVLTASTHLKPIKL